jgi:hypothetical protein
MSAMFSRSLFLSIAVIGLLPPPVRGDIFSVTTTSESGLGSLRQAILDANAHPNSSANDRDHWRRRG